MTSRVLGGILAIMVIAVLLGRRPAPVPPVAAPPAASDAPPPPPPQPSLRPNPAATAPVQGTPTIDLLAVLTIRRRIEREGTRVYLSQLFAETDSTVVRWPGRRLSVAFIPDTTLPGWSPALLDDARSGLQLWSGNGAGVQLIETRDTTVPADITVRWSRQAGSAQEAGQVSLEWQGGEITRASMVLGIVLNDSTPLTAEERRRTAGHEFGHALGLPHSNDFDDFMHPRTLVGAPSRRDQATLLLLYTVPPGSLRAPSM